MPAIIPSTLVCLPTGNIKTKKFRTTIYLLFLWVWNLVSDIKWRKKVEEFCEWDAGEVMWTLKGESDRRKLHEQLHDMNLSSNIIRANK